MKSRVLSVCSLAFFGALLIPTKLNAITTLYDNSASQTGFYALGYELVFFDDVVINASLLTTSQRANSILLDSVTVGITRFPAVAANVDIYVASFVQGFLTSSIDLDSASVRKIGTFSLAPSSTTATVPLVVNLASPVEVPVQYFGSNAYMAVGVQLTRNTSNGWRIMNYTADPAGDAFGCKSGGSDAVNANGQGPLNLGCGWEFDASTLVATSETGYSANYGIAQYITVTGAPAPVPAPLPFLGGVAAFGLSRKLRSRIKACA